MKYFFSYIFILLNSCLFAQDSTFIHVFHAPGNDRSEAMIQSVNGDFILCGSTSSFDALDTDVHVLRLDGNLNIQWSKHYGQPFVSEKGVDLLEDGEGNLFVTGYTNATGYDMLLMKISAEGDLLWSLSYGSEDWDFIAAMKFDNAGNLLLAGHSYAYADLSSQAWLLKCSNDGELLLEVFFGDEGDDSFSDIDTDAEGNIYLSGTYENSEDNTTTAWTMKCTAQAELIWEQFGLTWREEAFSVSILADRCFVHGMRTAEGFGESMLDYRYDLDGNYLSSNYFQAEGNTAMTECEIYGDQLILSGRQNAFGNGGYDFIYNSQDLSGMYGQARTTGGNSDDICTDVVHSNNDKLYFSGYTESFDAIHEDVMVTYSSANVPSPEAIIVLVETDDDFITSVPLYTYNAIEVYPNPFENNLNLKSPAQLLNVSVEFYSPAGRLIALLAFKNGENLDTSELASGTYLYRLFEDGVLIKSGQLIKD